MSMKASLELLQEKFRCEHCGACCQIGGNIVLSEQDALNLKLFLQSPEGQDVQLEMLCFGTNPKTYRFGHTSPCFLWNRTTRLCSCESFKSQTCRDYPFLALRDGKIA